MKSYVSMEQHQCFICGTIYDTGTILLDRRLKATLENTTLTGTGLCPEHQKLADDGYITLIVVKSDGKTRTGELCLLRKEIAEDMFDATFNKPITYIDQEVFNQLQELAG